MRCSPGLLAPLCLLLLTSSLLKAGQPDTLTSLQQRFEAEHRFMRQLSRPSGTALAGVLGGRLDLSHTIIDLRLHMEEGYVEGRAGLCLEFLTASDFLLELNLEGKEMQVRSVTGARGDSLEFNYSNETGWLEIPITGRVAGGLDTLWIAYAGDLYMQLEPDSTYPPDYPPEYKNLRQVITRDYAYSLSQGWYPALTVNDDPGKKLSFDISLTVPPGFTAAASGDSVEVSGNPDSTRTFRFSTRAYGRSAQSATFSVARYETFSLEAGNTKVKVYSSLPNTSRISNILVRTEEILNYFETLYGGTPYPWKELNIVECGRPNFSLGLADHSLLFLPREFFEVPGGKMSYSDLAFLSHEIAHQWWGLLVGSDWNESNWLGEGMAQFSSYTFIDTLLRQAGDSTNSLWNGYQVAFNIKYGPENYGLPPTSPDAPYYVVYERGAFIARSLQYIVGEEAFRSTLRSFLEDKRLSFVSLRDFSDYWTTRIPDKNLDVFFEQWLFKGGCPDYKVRSRSRGAGDSVSVEVRIDQGREFDLPLGLALYLQSGGMDAKSERVYLRTHQFSYQESAMADSVRLDPGDFIADLTAYIPEISLSRVRNSMDIDIPQPVAVQVDSLTGVHSAVLSWRAEGGTHQAISFSPTGRPDTLWIPAQGRSAQVEYYVLVESESGDSLYNPPGAPDSALVFRVTAPQDRPAEVAWVSTEKLFHRDGEPVEEDDLTLYDLESGEPLHTFPGLGGKLALSPDNRYLVTGSSYKDRITVIDLQERKVVHEMPIPKDWGPDKLQIAEDGKTVYMSSYYWTDSSLVVRPVDVYRLDLERQTIEKIVEMNIFQDRVMDILYNPVDSKLYVQVFDGRVKILAWDSRTAAIQETAILSSTKATLGANYGYLLEMAIDREAGEYYLREISLLNSGVREKGRIADKTLISGSIRSNPGLSAANEIGACFSDLLVHPHKLYLIDFPNDRLNEVTLKSNPHESIPEIFDLYSTPSGRYMVAPYLHPFGDSGRTLLTAVMDLNTLEVSRYLYSDEEDIFSIRGVATENIPYDRTAQVHGDADGNGRVDIFDLLDLLKSLSNAPGHAAGLSSDVDGNGEIDIFDLLELLKLLKN